MANDATTQIPQGSHEADMAGTHDGDYAAVQVAEATAATATAPSPSTPADGKVVHVEIPQGGTVVRVPVQAGETVILPPPFDSHHDLAAKEGNGNLAVKVGDVTVILQGYIEASNDPAHPVTIDGSDGQPVDIATVLASTDPNLDIQTAAGPAAGAQGADNTGAILAALAGGPGLGGLNAVGVLDATELQYKLIDNSIRQEQETLLNGPGGPLTLTLTPPNHDLHQAFLHDPIVTRDTFSGHLDFDSFINGIPGSQFAGFDNGQADFDGTLAAPGLENEHAQSGITVDPSNNTTVQVTLTTDALAAQGLTSNGIPLTYEVSQDGSTIFGFRGDGSGGTDGALVLVVHVEDGHPGAGTAQEFTVDYYLVNRLDDTKGDGTSLDLDVSFNVNTGDDRSTSGVIHEHVVDDQPVANPTDYSNEENGKTTDSTVIGKVDEDFLSKGNHDKNSDGTGNAGQHGDDTGSAHVAGQLAINYGADGPAGFVLANSSSAPASNFSALQLENPATDTAYAVGDTISGVTSHGNALHVLSIVTGVDGVETLTVGYGTTSVFTLALHTDPNDAQLGHFDFNLLTGVDNSIGKDTEGNATVSLGAVGTDDDGDPVHTTISIQINDDIPGIPDQHDNPDTPTTAGGYAIVDEDQLSGGAHDDNVKVHGTTTASGQVNVDFGGDGAGSFGFTGITEGAPVTLVGGGALKTDDGTAVVFHVETKNGHEIVTGMAGNVEVFKLDLNTDMTSADIGKWTFTLEQPVSHPIAGSEDDLLASFGIQVTDGDGSQATGAIKIDINDDSPVAHDDADVVDNTTNTATGNVVTGKDTTDPVAGKDVSGADSPVHVIAVNGAAAGAGGGFTAVGQFGTLVMDDQGQYTYTRKDGSPDNSSESFTYTIVDKDGDTSTATLTVGVNDKVPTLHVPTDAGETTVNEKGLGVHGSNWVGSGEIADGNANNNSDKSEIVNGKITYTDGDAPATVTIEGKAVTAGMDFVHADGTLHINSIGNGEVDYTYTLTTNTNGDTTHDDFAVTVTDKDGDKADGTLVINIVDDTPKALDDSDTVDNQTIQAKGNVVTGANTDTGDAGKDVGGADGFKSVTDLTGLNGSATPADHDASNGLTVTGKYGTLVMDPATGEYTYTRFNGDPLKDSDTFTYSIVDGDGDKSTATLTINIDDSGCHISNLTPELNGGDSLVNEDHLLASRGAGESAGTDPTGATTGAGDFNITAPDGVGTLTVGGKDVIVDGKFTAVTIDTPLGNKLSIDSYDAATGKIGYHYTLLDNETHSPVQGPNSLFENFKVTLTDKDGDKAPDDTLSINIVDDVPTTTGGSKDVSTAGQYNLMLTIDLSNSMNDSSGVNKPDGTGTYTKLELEKAAIADLLATYQAQGDVAVHVTWFNDPGSGGPNGSGDPSNPGVGANDGGWMTVSQAIAYVNGLVAQGNTNYDVAINQAEQSFADKTGYIAGGTNVSYFFSDGMPNENSGPGSDGKDGIGGPQQTAWETFLDNNNVNSFAIGVGGQAISSALTPIAYNGASTPATDPAGNTIVVTDLNQLSTVVSQTAAAGAHGNLFGDLNAVYGADGAGHVNMFTLNGTEHDYDAAHPIVKVDLAQGSFTMDMNTGDYTFTPNTGAAQSSVQIKFNVVDSDGDVSNTSTLTLTTANHAPVISSNSLADAASIQVIEGAKNVTTVHAIDVDGTVTYSISGGADASKFSIDKDTGVLTFLTGHTTANPQDAGGNNVYDVIVTATDNEGAKDSQALAVQVEAAAVAVADHIYTNSSGNLTVLDQFLLNNDTDKDTSHALISVSDIILTPGQATYFDKDHLATHGPDTHGSGWTTFNLDTDNDGKGDGYLKSGDSTGFDYTATDGAGAGPSAHVTITYTAGSTIDASGDSTGAILMGTSGNETMKGGSGADVFVTNGGNDTINGGAGFDQVALSGTTTWSKAYTNVEMANIHDGEISKLTINAADVFQQSAGTVGGKDVDLFVTGDHQGTAQDTVNLNGFSSTAVGSGTFTDAGTHDAHTYDLYQGTGANAGVIVAVEHDLTVKIS